MLRLCWQPVDQREFNRMTLHKISSLKSSGEEEKVSRVLGHCSMNFPSAKSSRASPDWLINLHGKISISRAISPAERERESYASLVDGTWWLSRWKPQHWEIILLIFYWICLFAIERNCARTNNDFAPARSTLPFPAPPAESRWRSVEECLRCLANCRLNFPSRAEKLYHETWNWEWLWHRWIFINFHFATSTRLDVIPKCSIPWKRREFDWNFNRLSNWKKDFFRCCSQRSFRVHVNNVESDTNSLVMRRLEDKTRGWSYEPKTGFCFAQPAIARTEECDWN